MDPKEEFIKMHGGKEHVFENLARKVDTIYLEIGENSETPKKVAISPVKQKLVAKPRPRTFKSVFGSFMKRLATSALIFVIVFFTMNWEAYSQIFAREWEEATGIIQESPLTKLTTIANEPTRDLLPVSKNPEVEKKQIPSLNLEVMPPDTRIVIPRIDKNVPIVPVQNENLIEKDWNALESDIQEALKEGVVHYPGTPMPGQRGNVVITGHSSYFPWAPGDYKEVFALLHEVQIGDRIVIYHNQKKYLYEVFDIKEVAPNDVDILHQTQDDRVTLITCTPIGTNLRRLIVVGKFIGEA